MNASAAASAVPGLRFSTWMFGTIALLVSALAASFLWLVFDELNAQARTQVERIFELRAEDAMTEIEALLRAQRQTAELVANLIADARVADTTTMVEPLVRALRSNPTVESVSIANDNDAFLQVNISHDQSQPGQATGRYSVRWIRNMPDGRRIESSVERTSDGGLKPLAMSHSSFRPSERDWYVRATASGATVVSPPIPLPALRTHGLVIASPTFDGEGVVAVVVPRPAIDRLLERVPLSPGGLTFIVDAGMRVIGYRAQDGMPLQLKDARTARDPTQADGRLARFAVLRGEGTRLARDQVQVAGKSYIVAMRVIEPVPGTPYFMYVASPIGDFASTASQDKREVATTTALALLAALLLGWVATRHVARPLTELVRNADLLQRLDFSVPPIRPSSFVREIRRLCQAREVMQRSIAQHALQVHDTNLRLKEIVDAGVVLGREHDPQRLMQRIVASVREIGQCDMVELRVRDDQDVLRSVAVERVPTYRLKPEFRARGDELSATDIPLYDSETGKPRVHSLAATSALSGTTRVIDNVMTDPRPEVSSLRDINERLERPIVTALVTPIVNAQAHVLGTLSVANASDPRSGKVIAFDAPTVQCIEALTAQAAVAIENHKLLADQRRLMDAIIQILAGAIDAKSAYTGGHCARVPELAFMLAEAACEVSHGPLADFRFTCEEQWHEFRIGAWLHDCGKVTTPEYVVDKATKLETIYNRIHELRTRFEVLLRDAHIDAWRAIDSGTPRDTAWAAFNTRRQQLADDFAFVAQCNIGAESMAPDHVARLHRIASQTWLRHFDDHLGLSHAELERHADRPAPTLPVAEPLIADRPEHRIPRPPSKALDPAHGFQLPVPELLYHHGELHNLCISRGTLTAEERFKINEHIIHTIVMLESMPFPRQLKRVPEYAGTHHETLTGTGYPRKLTADQLSVPARIMAIADIFEALTASDRPYKRAKSLSEAIAILHRLKRDQHIDPHLFDLFLSSGAYLSYARKFLAPEQIDHVDVAQYLN